MPEEAPHRPGRRVEDETTVEADPVDVYRAWADPEELARWFVDRSGGKAEAGGEMVWAWDAYDVEHSLEVVAAEEGRRLVLRTTWGGGSLTVIEVVLEPVPEGTRVRLVHSGFGEGADWAAEYESTRSGWTNALAHLKTYLERYRGRDKRALDLLRPAPFEAGDLRAATRTAAGLARWLGRAQGDLGPVGAPVRIDLHGNGSLTGEVIARTDWETALTWEEMEGVLTFMAFPGGGDGEGRRHVGLRAISWAGDDRLEGRRRVLESALDRLVDVL